MRPLWVQRLRRWYPPWPAWLRAVRAWPRAVVGWLFSLRGALALLIVVAGLGLATALYLVRRDRLQRRVIEEYDRANALYREGDLTGAREGFQRALRLIDSLGGRRHFLEAEVRRKYHESRVIADLLPIDLEELARRAYAAASPEAWRQTFQAEYAGRTVVFGPTTLMARPATAIGYEVRTADGQRLALDFTGCDLFAGPRWKAGMRVLFAATLDRMTFRDTPGGSAERWTLHFAPGRYLLILDEWLLQAGPLEIGDDVKATIARQRETVRH